MRLKQLKGVSDPQKIAEILSVGKEKEGLFEQFLSLPFPDKKSEAYRYADMDSVWEQDIDIVSADEVEPRASKHLVITNGVVTEKPSSVDIKYSKEIDVESSHYDPIYYLSHALSSRYIDITLQDGDDLTIEHHIYSLNALIPYRIRISVEPNSHAAINEKFVDMGSDGSVLMMGYDISILADSTLKWIKDQTLVCGNYTPLFSHSINVGKNSLFGFASYDFGSGHGIQQMRVELGDHAQTNLDHLLYTSDEARMGTVSQIIHSGEHSHSRQNAKNILKDSSRGVFDALIRVDNSAKYTKAHQNSKAILLDSGTYMASKPQLEIYIDELEASHGSTTGQLDEKQLFYLRSRSISEIEARKMLILAFANELIDSIDNETLRNQVHGSFERAYYGETRLECIETCHGCEEKVLN